MEGIRSLEEILKTNKDKGENPRSGCGRHEAVKVREVDHRAWGTEVREDTQLARRQRWKGMVSSHECWWGSR